MPVSSRPDATLTRLGWGIVVLACLEVQTTSALAGAGVLAAGVLAAAALPIVASVAGRPTPTVQRLVLGALIAQSLLHAALAIGTCLSDRPGEGAIWHLAILITSVAAIRVGDTTIASTCVGWGHDLVAALTRCPDVEAPATRAPSMTADLIRPMRSTVAHTLAPTRGPPRRRAHWSAPSTITTPGGSPVTAHSLVPSLL